MYASNNPGYTVIHLTNSNTVASITYNEAAKLAEGDQRIYLKVGSLLYPMDDDPTPFTLTFGSRTLIYANGDSHAVSYTD